MTRAYIRLDPAFDERKESYPDGPYAALVATFCLAEHQPERGRFRSLDYLRRLLGHRGRHLAFLVTHGDVTQLPDGKVYVDGWDEWQEGDWKVAERVARIRNRPRGTPPVTPKVTPPVTVDVTLHPPKADETDSLSGGGGGAMSAGAGGDSPPADELYPETIVVQWLAIHGCYVGPTSGYMRNIVTAIERHGPRAFIEAMERLRSAGQPNGDVKGYVFGAIDLLDKQARPSLSIVDKAAREENRSEGVARRVQATKVRAHESGAHAEPNPGCPLCEAA